MTIFFQATIVDIGPEVAELLEGGVLILYALGAPPELAEVSVLHLVEEGPTPEPPPVGARFSIGAHSAVLTAVGERAWRTIGDIGHVVINFNGAPTPERPGEICVEAADTEAFAAMLVVGSTITIEAA